MRAPWRIALLLPLTSALLASGQEKPEPKFLDPINVKDKTL